jgi:hypothetical protein
MIKTITVVVDKIHDPVHHMGTYLVQVNTYRIWDKLDSYNTGHKYSFRFSKDNHHMYITGLQFFKTLG